MVDSRLSEFELIARLTQGLPLRTGVVLGVGDDCAILDTGGNTLLLATCDSQVEGVHFTFQTYSPEEIGRKAVAINISDIAAMGGEPRFALISLVLPLRQSQELIERVFTGLRQEAEQFAIAIAGGNMAAVVGWQGLASREAHGSGRGGVGWSGSYGGKRGDDENQRCRTLSRLRSMAAGSGIAALVRSGRLGRCHRSYAR